MAVRVGSAMSLFRSARPYSLYVLLVLMVVYLLNQLDRLVLGIAGESISRDLQFGALGCSVNVSELFSNTTCIDTCYKSNYSVCDGRYGCMWDYTGTGIEYQVLAGPAFTFVFTVVALPLGMLAGLPGVNRKLAIALCLVLWSAMTLASSFTVAFWQLLLTRVGLGIFEAVCTPFSSSIISDMFKQHKATALGFYNWGIYIGYSIAFAFNFILLSVGWRWTFRVAALPGFLVGAVMLFTVKELPHSAKHMSLSPRGGDPFFLQMLKAVLKPSMLLLCLAGGIRQGGGLVWAYNVKSYFDQYYCSSTSVGVYLSWVPLVGGTLGSVLGGLVSDKLVQKRGQMVRLWVLVISQLCACPFLVGAVLLPPPWAFLCLLPAYIIGEVWIGVCLAVVIELVPGRVLATAVAFFLFVINNIGGALPLLIPALEAKIDLRNTILLLFPGTYLLAAALFAVVLLVIKCEECWRQSQIQIDMDNEEEESFLIAVENDQEPFSVNRDERQIQTHNHVEHSYYLSS